MKKLFFAAALLAVGAGSVIADPGNGQANGHNGNANLGAGQGNGAGNGSNNNYPPTDTPTPTATETSTPGSIITSQTTVIVVGNQTPDVVPTLIR